MTLNLTHGIQQTTVCHADCHAGQQQQPGLA